MDKLLIYDEHLFKYTPPKGKGANFLIYNV